MIGAPIRNAYLDDASVIAEARRAAWAIFNDKPHPGFRKLGSGHFSRVYAFTNRPGLVLKVGGPGGYGDTGSRSIVCGDRAALDDAWPQYAVFTANYKKTTGGLLDWMPNIYHVERLSGEFYFAVTERLSEQDGYDPVYSCRNLGKQLNLLSAAAPGYGAQDDLHSANIMLRGDKPVITDPWKGPSRYATW